MLGDDPLETPFHSQACTNRTHSRIFLSTFFGECFYDVGFGFVHVSQDEMSGGVRRDNGRRPT
jgi:hypothetical protein